VLEDLKKARWYLNRKIEQLVPMPQVDKATLYYLATPYSKYPRGLIAAFEDAANLAARLLQVGFRVYSPISHTHPLAVYGKIDPLDHAIWLPFDEAMMEASGALLVAEMSGWRTSKGVKHEIEFFTNAGKPVLYLNPETLFVAATPSAPISASEPVVTKGEGRGEGASRV
jgi:hypothetical protein